MKKIIGILFAMLPLLVTAQVTPEAIYGLCPPFPTQSEIVGCKMGDEAGCAAVDKYLSMLDTAIMQAREALAKYKKAANVEGKAMDDANKAMKNQLGITVDEARNMSEAELKRFGEDKANARLKSLGVNKSVKELENRELSEAEKQQMAAGMVRNATGMSLAELQALGAKMEGMSEEEQIAYMQRSGAMQKMMDNAGKIKPAAPVERVGAKFEYSERYGRISEELNAMRGGTIGFIESIEDKWTSSGYEARQKPWREKLGQLPPGYVVDYKKDGIAAEGKALKAIDLYESQTIIPAMRAIESEFYSTISVPRWYERQMKILSLTKQLPREITPIFENMTDYEKEVYKIAMAEQAIDYLREAKELVDAPRAGVVHNNYND